MENVNSNQIVALSFDEVASVNGAIGILEGAAIVIGIAVAIVQLGAAVHDATCSDYHK